MPDAPYSLLAQLESVKDKARPPIHLWNPDNVKDIDMEIRKDGAWFYMGTPIERIRLVRLFSTVLRREADDYFLVTPVEKCRIRVEDVPFQAILLNVLGEGSAQSLQFTTNVGEEVVAGIDHPVRVAIDPDSDEPSPYVGVRDGLEARISRSVYYQLAELLVEREIDGRIWMGVFSEGEFFPFIAKDRLA
ncbi:MAG TPA: DUF1285 domain-containing protein [Pseudomonadales bacterium]|nr:DUF1285 domain-containing protein [Pseudomonadales bacterium]